MDVDLPPMSPVPAHSPYQRYEWVRCHGYPGHQPGPTRWGFRGYVLGSLGATILRGVTDDGRPWSECWGALEPDRPNQAAVVCCTCCPRRRPSDSARKTTSRPPKTSRSAPAIVPAALAALYVPDPDQMPLFELGQG